MRSRQTMPKEWLIIAGGLNADAITAAKRLPRGSGILVLKHLGRADTFGLHRIALQRDLAVIFEHPRLVARVHNVQELRKALLARTPLVLLSPLYATGTHPDWSPIPRMRAAALARLSRRRLLALGGLTRKRYATLERLGFLGWAGISAWTKVFKVT